VRRKVLGLVAGVLALCSSVQAATLCSVPGVHPDGLDVTDIPILSAFSIYARDFRGPIDNNPPPPPVDEPGTLALLGIGVLGLALVWRRSRRT